MKDEKNVEQELLALQQKLSHSHNLMQYIIEHSRSAIAVHDRELRYIYVSQRYLSEYGIGDKDIIGKHHYEVFPDLPQRWKDVHQRALNGEICNADDDPYQKRDGTTEWTRWECRPWYGPDGSIGGIIVYTEVITRKKEAELELIRAKEKAEESEERYRMFIEQTNEGIYRMEINPPVSTALPVEEMVDYIYDHSKIVECNNALLKMYNTSERSFIVGKGLIDLHEGKDHPVNREEVKKFVLNGFRIENSETIEKDYEDKVHYFSSGTIGIIKNNMLTSIWGTQLDITDKKKYELELLEARDKAEENNRLKTAFLQNMSHEVRTPLNTIVGFSQLISGLNSSDENLKYYSEMISSSSDKLVGIISDVIEISQIQTNQITTCNEKTDIHSILEKLVQNYITIAERKNTKLILNENMPDGKSIILSDARKVEKILQHLIDNAVKFTYGGTVEVTVQRQDDAVTFIVGDTGIGIPREMHDIVFEPFRQVETDMSRTHGGNGLGLTIVRSYTELLKGSLALSSEPGLGTIVTVTIPDNSKPSERSYGEKAKDEKERPTVLIVEDEYSSFRYLQELLREEAVKIMHAVNGREAVEMCRTFNDISLILMDIKMPVLDGKSSAKMIKEFRPDIPIIAQTAYALESEREYYTKFFDDLVAKPINRKEFRQLIKKYI